MNQKLFFGAAYYLEYMPCQRLEKDIVMMKEAGFNVLRIAESTWSTLEPTEGVYDFSYVDQVLEIAEREDLSVIIGTPTYAIPSWLEKKDPSVMVEDKNGRKRYGHRQSMDIMNPTYRMCAERVIRRLMEHVAGHPTVIGYQIDNETKHYGTASKHVQQLFKEWLKEKYETCEALNHAFHLSYWSNSIHDWEDLPDMRGCINGGLASEFAIFQRKLAADFLKWQSEIVTEYKGSDQFITHNFDFEWKKFGADIAQDGYSYGVQPDINHYEAREAVTIAGTDIYHPTQDHLTGAEIAFGGDSIRSLKNSNYLVLETQAQAFKYWTPYPGQLRLQAYSHLASGANGVMYWNWHSIHNGYETYWKGLLSHDFAWNPTYGEACKIGEEWRTIGGELMNLQKKNRIAIITDTHCLDAFRWFPVDRDLSYNDIVRWMYDALYELNLECDIVDVQGLDTEQYDMLVVPALYSASEQTIQKLRSFVEQGGVLVASFKSFVADEHLTVYHDSQPHHLTDVMGVTYNQFTEAENLTVDGAEVRYFAELLTAKEGDLLASYTHRYWGAYGAVSRNSFGKGYAYYIGCFLAKEKLKDYLRMAAQTAGIALPEHQWPVTIRNGVSPKGNPIHYVLHYSQENETIPCGYDHATDLLTGTKYQKGDPILLKDWDVLILKED